MIMPIFCAQIKQNLGIPSVVFDPRDDPHLQQALPRGLGACIRRMDDRTALKLVDLGRRYFDTLVLCGKLDSSGPCGIEANCLITGDWSTWEANKVVCCVCTKMFIGFFNSFEDNFRKGDVFNSFFQHIAARRQCRYRKRPQ
ncbi:hypothetical protein VOLCADRAFT_90408 [Volvox carteri f. nagariensis]|uniref:Uncharacterized protein n=1 Tax=Volvox carteri f. nagariensis TaxID=3068 RepID=D8TUA5_VOLCA|nr:uncharacterized protein VOLCADRAFT_90408 [Volvox carteri f. nagariensis]EFJ49003.1 hypothetical protein VOLCADRAFT_90408 [Volvox carteri f. nagariensis]|eukprot:XP_002949900.1 hypothetical protein VOLCADRAFT_90408 [Volvox carteri f. nagariensis]